jgi:hypothetical protein
MSRLLTALVLLSLGGLGCATMSAATTEAPAEAEAEESTTEETESKPIVELKRLEAPEGFVVQMPGEPQAQRGKVAIPGGEVSTAAWAANVEGVLYSISTADYPEKVVAANPAEAFLNEGKTGLVNQLKGNIEAEEDITLQGYPGKSFTVTSDAGEVKARNFLVGNRLYTLLTLYNPSIGAPHADEFLTSLELIDPPPSIAKVPKAPKAAPAPDAGKQ